MSKAPNGLDVVIGISGSGPFNVCRATDGRFALAALLADSVQGDAYTDVGAVKSSAPVYFYDVEGVGEAGPGNAGGGPPQSVVQITSLTPNVGKTADSVVIAGSGFAPVPGENLVTFNGVPALVIAGSTTSLTVTVPPGSTTGPVSARVGAQLSNSLPFTIAPLTGFANLTALAGSPDSVPPARLFLGDAGAAAGNSLITIDRGNFSTLATGYGIANIRGFGLSSDNRLYFGNGSMNAANSGIIYYTDVTQTGGARQTFRSGGLTGVAAAAYGSSPANPNYVFVADQKTHRILRVQSAYDYPFPIYASGFNFGASTDLVSHVRGLAFDTNGIPGTTSFGDLYVSSGDSVYRVQQSDPGGNMDNTTTTKAVGLVSPSGLSFDDDHTLIISDSVDNSVGVYRADSNAYQQRLGGLNAPRMAVIETTTDSPPETRTYIAEPTRLVVADDIRVELEPHENIRALISNCPGASPGCVGVPYPSAYQTADHQVRFTATVHPARGGVTVYFELADPADTAPYVTGTVNDNHLGDFAPFTSSAVTDAAGRAAGILTITDEYAGNNYRILARLNSPTGPVVARSGLITAWKRIFIELDRMYRMGTYLAADASAGSSTILVVSSAGLSSGNEIELIDTVNDTPTPAKIDSINDNTITLTAPLTKSFLKSRYAAVGKPAAGYFEADLSATYRTFQQAFTEIIYLPAGSNPVPYQAPSFFGDEQSLIDYSHAWFRAGTGARSNYIHVIGIDGLSYMSGLYGMTQSAGRFCYVCRGKIESDVPYASFQVVTQNTTNHELVHQFGPDDHRETSPPAWCAGQTSCANFLCLMSIGRDRTRDFELENLELVTGDTDSIRSSLGPF